MPSTRCSTSSQSRRTGTAAADLASRSPTRSMRRTRQEKGKPCYEAVETREEVTTYIVTANHVHAAVERSPPHQEHVLKGSDRRTQSCSGAARQEYPRLAYYGNDRAPRTNQSAPEMTGDNARRRPQFGALAVDPGSRYGSAANRGRPTCSDNATSNFATRRHAAGAHPSRSSRIVKAPADISTLEDYKTPTRRRRSGGRYAYDHGVGHTEAPPAWRGGRHGRRSFPADVHAHDNVDVEETETNSAAAAAAAEPYHFRIRLHECRGVFADLKASCRPPPAVYFAVHTVEERGHSDIADKGSYNPVFYDEFMFSSADPEHDALVCTLVAASSVNTSRGSRMRRDKKVAECVLALHNLAWQVERKVWVPLVRHPGTSQAYEQGEVLVSIYSADFGYDDVATEEEEAACSAAIHDTLTRYAPQELHRLDWMTSAYVNKGPEALSQLRASYRARTVEPVPVRVTVQRVEGLTDEAGGPTRASDIYVVVGDGRVERRSKTVPYRRCATVNQEFNLALANPAVDALSVTVLGNGRKLGEAVAGLTNVQAGKAKEVTLMLVRAAETGDASNGGQVTLTLQTEKYSSPYQMSAKQEARLRERVLAHLWCYLRDDLHRLDAIVGSIDNEEVYMQKWARTVGPEQKPRRLQVSVREARNIIADGGLPPRCYARITAGPTTVRTELATVRNGVVTFKDSFRVQVYDLAHDAVEVMIVAEGDDGEREMSRVCFGVATLPRQCLVLRTLHLVSAATKRAAHVQGELTVELLAEDFGLTGALAVAAAENTSFASSVHMQRLEAIMQRSSPEKLHRVPYMLDTAPPGKAERVVEDEAKQHGGDVAVAPMTVKILGVKAFKPAVDFYVKVYLNNEPILRTGDVRGSTVVTIDIEDNNEATVRLKDAPQAVMTFKIAQHRTLRKTAVLGEAEVALVNLVRGEKNVLWVPFFQPAKASASGSGGESRRCSASCTSDSRDNVVKLKGNRMPNSNGTAAARQQRLPGASLARHGAAAASPVGMLGLELQSNAFPETTVTEYKLGDESGRKGVSAQEAVTEDVTSLIAKMRPSELPKVQPMIAQCTSLKSAHDELRAELSTRPILCTVYVNIESVDLATETGKTQEAQGGVAVEAVYGSERQESRKRTGFANDALHQRQLYTQIRLDIPAKLDGAISGRNGATSRSAAYAKGAPALELRLIGVHGNEGASGAVLIPAGGLASGGAFGEGSKGAYHYDAADSDSDATADPYYAGGENNLHSYIRFPQNRGRLRSTTQPEEEHMRRPSKMRIMQQGQRQSHPHRNGGSTVSSHSNHYHNIPEDQYSSYREEDGKRYLGGANNIHSYVGSPGQSFRHSIAGSERTPPRHQVGLANASGSNRQAGSTSRSSTAASVAYKWSAPYRGEIGVVRLSLRALLTRPLYTIGDTLRVPIVAPVIPAKLSYHARCSPAVNQRCIVGHVTLRLTLPAFEHVPESLRLGGHNNMSKVVPGYVHYYERRISAYLRSHNARDLVSFHYDLYERDVVSGCWPVSLPQWMQTLIKRFGPETEYVGPVPSLPLVPEEWELVRQRADALRREREAALAPWKQGSKVGDDHTDDHIDVYSSRGASPSVHSRGNSPGRSAWADRRKGSSVNGRLDAGTASAEAVHRF
ncbi:predicted C2 domain protein [Leishmania donovani]|uniref:Predicted_C2_domain_protein/GeneDB:LmjF.36.4330 n=1 Tax=Leishmania donovani TaxID=5661 RepID=A0A6J8FUP3_LEIDO|nr:predicted C2 domain protein [Leishmania donovani]VDZ49649.1 predicted_C2_domain_protein/GeneDB:LmjF.36.4330 [Leishmania donovani]